MKILKDHFLLVLIVTLFSVDMFLSVVPPIFPAHSHRHAIFHKIQTIANQSAVVADVDLFERADDSDAYVPVFSSSSDGGPSITALLVLSYALGALYVARRSVSRPKVSFDCLWQKTTNSL